MDKIEIESFVGAFMPLLIDLVNQHISSEKWRFAISVISCFIVGAALNYEKLVPFQWEHILSAGASVFITSQLTYKLYWEKSKAREAFSKAIK